MSAAHTPKPDAALMRIGDAAKAAGVSRQTIEYYIMLGMIHPIRQEGRRSRYFDDALVRRIRLIRQLNDSGYTLRDIRETYLRHR
ncbi:MAG: MerR family transcriptional regulator [Planctomycetota bacterium]